MSNAHVIQHPLNEMEAFWAEEDSKHSHDLQVLQIGPIRKSSVDQIVLEVPATIH